mgnify:CR=1 FL=1|tara:strand:+ start:220 stop:546 length:327 start_codon:yes stop_codon:yes gene_type:complete
MNRVECLDNAKTLITKERAAQYGGAYLMHQRIADLWNGYLHDERSAVAGSYTLGIKDVVVMMILLKAARLRVAGTSAAPEQNGHDSYVDICGYAALGCELTSGNDEGC